MTSQQACCKSLKLNLLAVHTAAVAVRAVSKSLPALLPIAKLSLALRRIAVALSRLPMQCRSPV